MDAAFRVIRNGRETLHTEEELRHRAAGGLVAPGDLVYHPILGRWLYAREVEELRDALTSAAHLGRPVSPSVPLASNGEAIAGFILGVLGHLPLVGFLCCVLGIYFSSRGLKRAAEPEMSNRGHGLAVAGMVLSIVFLVPATACSAVFLAGLMSPNW